jgi:hypothetical protein
VCPKPSSNTEVRQHKVQALYEKLVRGQIVLPRFQRTEVWGQEKKRDLINSIRKRLPIGSLLVYEPLDPNEQGRQVLVDGLQRTIAIRDYMTAPQQFITAESLKGPETDSLLEAVQAVAAANGKGLPTESAVLGCVDNWIKRAPNLDTASLTADILVDIIQEQLGIEATTGQQRDLRDVTNLLITHIQNDAKIDDYPLALVEFTGDARLLPEIFRNINSGGVPLDDFDELATFWIDFKAEIRSQDVAQQIANKWTAAERKGLIVERWSAGGPTDGYTFWEYIYGLGRVLKKEYPLLFGRLDENGTDTERVSFYLVALAHGLVPRQAEIRHLPFLLSIAGEGSHGFDLIKFESALRKACKQVEDWIRPSAGMKLNVSDARLDNLSQLSHFLVLSMVARTLVGRWIPYTWDERSSTDWRGDWLKLGEELPRQLLFEVLQGSWSGAGDSNALSATWDSESLRQMDLSKGFDPASWVPSDLYVRHRTADEWRQLLDVWLRSETHGATRVYRKISKEAKLVLRYVYSDMRRDWHEQYEFQVDHQLPVARLSRIIERNNAPGWPMSAVGNLALLPGFINEAKNERTPREYLDSLTPEQQTTAQPLVEYGSFFDLGELTIPQDDEGVDQMSRDQFIDLIERRQRVIRDKVISALGL